MSAKDEIEAINGFTTRTNNVRRFGNACRSCGHPAHGDKDCPVFNGAAVCVCGPTSSLRTREGDQVLPTAGGASVTEEVIRRFREREKLGIKRYGRSLETFNGRDGLVDMLEERYDELQYFTKMLMERDASVEESARLLTKAFIELRSRKGDPPSESETTAYTAGVQDAARIYFLAQKAPNE